MIQFYTFKNILHWEEIYKDRHSRMDMVPQAVIVPNGSAQTRKDYQGEGFNGETLYIFMA